MTQEQQMTHEELREELREMLGPQAASAFSAVVEACRNPGVLVRVTFTKIEQVAETLNFVVKALDQMGVLDYDETEKAIRERPRSKTVELLNGSAIEFVLERV